MQSNAQKLEKALIKIGWKIKTSKNGLRKYIIAPNGDKTKWQIFNDTYLSIIRDTTYREKGYSQDMGINLDNVMIKRYGKGSVMVFTEDVVRIEFNTKEENDKW